MESFQSTSNTQKQEHIMIGIEVESILEFILEYFQYHILNKNITNNNNKQNRILYNFV